MLVETIATFGLMFFLFSVGVKMDTGMMVVPERKAMAISISVTFFTLALTSLLSVVLKKCVTMDASLAQSLTFIAASQCLTPFPNIACLLTELKILNTDLGRLAISSAMFCDILGISLTAVGFALAHNTDGSADGSVQTSVLACLSIIAFLVAIVYVIRPVVLWILRRTPEGEPHFVLGPLIFGLAVPDGPPLGSALTTKLDSLVTGLLYPTYLTVSGLQTNIFKINFQSSWIVFAMVFFASLVKIGAVILPACCSNMSVREAIIVGLMLNARGICELMVYNLWKKGNILNDQEFALAVISVIGVTAIITPLIRYLYDPSKLHVPTKRRTIQQARRDPELRIMHFFSSSLLAGPPPVLVAHQSQHQPQRTLETSNSWSNHIINALRQYELQNKGCASVQSFSCIAHFNTMHEDIYRVANDQTSTILIVPFHKQWAIDGSIGSVNRAIRTMNIKILDTAPCSVGILVDRGILSGSLTILNNRSVYHVAVIYISGADDGEALCYGARMAKHRYVTLTVIRFLLFGCHNARERKLDNDLIDEVRYDNVGNKGFLYKEEVVRDGVGLASSIKPLENRCDLIVVGRHHQESPLLLGLDAWSECPELGVIGDMLASPDHVSTASVLVVQQQKVGAKLLAHSSKQVFNDTGRREVFG
ncbi:hypothetical protein F0562_031530 [Nyssa sinensis]|uniref:Cation/H+ exchanger domain-containing protein n=1 Tax=Nyssa sinensis TaxID=561372 RepID=A0A5J5ASS4_9ASTE|nr:hypothetical protein F0562_031530 [Nyssa sinensis]